MHFSSYGPVSNVSFFGLRKTFSHKRRTHCSWQEPALPPPRPPRTWKPPFLPNGHRHSVLHPQSPPGKGSGPKPWPAGSGRSFSWKSTSFLSVRWFLFLGESSLALEYHTAIIFSTIILFFVLIYIFSVLRQRAACCGFCPAGAGGPTLHPGLSNFYQNIGFLPSCLIFHSLHPCRAS